jgi:hypothetical protein
MDNWEAIVRNYLVANPENQTRNEKKHQTFVNLTLGECYSPSAESPQATTIMKNIRPYDIGVVPESLSIKDGNGKVVLLTCGADMNGKVDDARLDYEIKAWTESGNSYSIQHGAIGTFIPRENSLKEKTDRKRWSYEMYGDNSVWKEFEKVINAKYKTDTGIEMSVFLACLDTGYEDKYAFNFIERSKGRVVGVKGNKEDVFVSKNRDVSYFKVSNQRPDLFIVQVGEFKDDIADHMKLRWDNSVNEVQPIGFMNFPTPSKGLYLFENYFSHFEAEHRTVVDSKNGDQYYRWVKKGQTVQNHLYDCHIYNMAAKEIAISQIAKNFPKVKPFTWEEYVKIALAIRK